MFTWSDTFTISEIRARDFTDSMHFKRQNQAYQSMPGKALFIQSNVMIKHNISEFQHLLESKAVIAHIQTVRITWMCVTQFLNEALDSECKKDSFS